MNEHSRDRSGAYVPRPRGKSAGSFTSVPLGAGVAAAAAGLVFLLAPGFRTQQAPSPVSPAPAAEPAPMRTPSAPVAAAAVAASAAPAAISARAQGGSEREALRPPVARPSWADAKVDQMWLWPRHLAIRNDEGTIDRKLIGWFPSNPAAKRLLYSLTVDRVETRLYEDEIAAFEARLAAEAEARRQAEEEAARRAEALAHAQAASARETAMAQAQEALAAARAREAAMAEAAAAAQAAAPAAVPATTAQTKAPPAKRRPTASRVGQIAFQAGRAAYTAAPAIAAAAPAIPDARPAPAPYKESAEVTAALKEIRALELKELQKESGAIKSRDVTGEDGRRMAELTYADGRTETVPYDPLVFDLKGTGIKTSPKKVLFDLYGYGKTDKTQWMNDLDENTGILVFDANGSGTSGKNGAEVFGDRTDLTGVGQPTGFADGFQALHALVLKAVDAGVVSREVLDNGILETGALAALEKAYGLRIKPGGFNRRPISLASAGIKAIALSHQPAQRAPDFDGQSNDLLVQPGAVFLRQDGTTGSYMNVWLKAKRGNLGLTTVNHLSQR